MVAHFMCYYYSKTLLFFLSHVLDVGYLAFLQLPLKLNLVFFTADPAEDHFGGADSRGLSGLSLAHI
jgi:hypothetical protein